MLTGPWTDEKLHFLEAVLEARPKTTSDEHKRLAEKGLMDAVKEDNHRAVQLLAAVSCDEQYTDPHKMDGMFVEPSMGEATFNLEFLSEESMPL